MDIDQNMTFMQYMQFSSTISRREKNRGKPIHTSFLDRYAFSLGEDKATWYATSFNAASDDILGLVGLTPSFLLQLAAPQWQS